MLTNLFGNFPIQTKDEEFTEFLSRKGARIVSTGQSTPVDVPYDQNYDERVLLLSSAAGVWIDGERDLRPGDHTLLPARCRRVT